MKIGQFRSFFTSLPLNWMLCLFLIWTVDVLPAQFPSNTPTNGSSYPTQRQPTQKQSLPEIDTLSKDVYYFYLDNPTQKTLLTDTLLHNFHIYDPNRQQEYDYVSTGNFGAAHRAIVYQPRFHKGFDAGFNQYDNYKFKTKDIRYYQLEKAHSDISFSQGASQEQTDFKAKFSKNLSPLTNFALNYHRINNNGQYTNQRSKNTSFTANSWYHSPSNRYQAYASYTTNTAQQLENGGVDFSDTLQILRKGIVSIGRPVNTEKAQARYFQRDLVFSHYYQLTNPANDTLVTNPPTGRKYNLFHQLTLRRNTYKYYDELGEIVSGYYGDYLKDDRGIRHFMDIRQYENTFSIRTFRVDRKKLSHWKGQSKIDSYATTKDLVEVGLTHTFTNISQEPVDSSLNNVFLFGKIQYTPSERLKIKTYAHFGALKQIGDYYVKGDFLLNLPKIGQLELGLIAQHYSPSLLQQQLYITQQNIWSNNFSKTFENSLSASYLFPFLNLQVSGQYHRISNLIYYNESSFPQQATADVNLVQLILKLPLQWRGFQLENTVYLQNSDQAFVRVPSFYSIHRLSLTSTLFKKVMNFQAGGQVRINTPYFIDNFQPVTAQFFLQNQQQGTYHPTIDAFINIKVQTFRFFINAENIFDYFTPAFNYPVYGYPQFDSAIRFGFRWQFLD